MERLFVIIDAHNAGQRIDKTLATACELTRTAIQQRLSDGHVFFAGEALTNPAAKAQTGTYEIHIPEVIPLALEPVAMPLDILFEDEHLLVINKQAGLTVHPAPGTSEPTLVHGLLAHCGDSLSGIGGVARPGIVHRLDKDTSGLMLVAKTDAAHQYLSAQLKDRTLSRTYQAICWGAPMPPSGTIDAPIGRHPKDRTRMAVVSRGGKEARTHYRTLQTFARAVERMPNGRAIGADGKHLIASHLECTLDSGRTHQIRVHLNHLGHGLIGDPTYGASTDNRLHKQKINSDSETICVLSNYRRQALHACNIRFKHPAKKMWMQFYAPLPDDMIHLISCLKDLQKQ